MHEYICNKLNWSKIQAGQELLCSETWSRLLSRLLATMGEEGKREREGKEKFSDYGRYVGRGLFVASGWRRCGLSHGCLQLLGACYVASARAFAEDSATDGLNWEEMWVSSFKVQTLSDDLSARRCQTGL
jgi:hypothetical protein